MGIKDSGATREYETGAHRDAAAGKGRCDLIPMREAADFTGDPVLADMASFFEDPDEKHLFNAMRASLRTIKQYGNCMAGFLLEGSHQYEEGALKYGENNWKCGMPLKVYIDCALRHYLKTIRGDDDEPHWRAFAWNMLGAVWTLRNTENPLDRFVRIDKNESTGGG